MHTDCRGVSIKLVAELTMSATILKDFTWRTQSKNHRKNRTFITSSMEGPTYNETFPTHEEEKENVHYILDDND